MSNGGFVYPGSEPATGCDFGKFVIEVAGFVEAFIKKAGVSGEIECFGKSFGNSVAGDLIVFKAVRGGNHDGIFDGALESLAHMMAGFLDEAFHRFAFFAAGTDGVAFANLAKSAAVFLVGLDEAFEFINKIFIPRCKLHFLQDFELLFVSAVKVLDLSMIEFV